MANISGSEVRHAVGAAPFGESFEVTPCGKANGDALIAAMMAARVMRLYILQSAPARA